MRGHGDEPHNRTVAVRDNGGVFFSVPSMILLQRLAYSKRRSWCDCRDFLLQHPMRTSYLLLSIEAGYLSRYHDLRQSCVLQTSVSTEVSTSTARPSLHPITLRVICMTACAIPSTMSVEYTLYLRSTHDRPLTAPVDASTCDDAVELQPVVAVRLCSQLSRAALPSGCLVDIPSRIMTRRMMKTVGRTVHMP